MALLGYIYFLLVLGVVGFQFALVFGAPWGHLTQGGKNEGALPVAGRAAAAASVVILAAMAGAILSAAGVWPNWPQWTGWAALAVNGLVMLANWATPSRAERLLWGPVTTVMLGLALAIMLSPTGSA